MQPLIPSPDVDASSPFRSVMNGSNGVESITAANPGSAARSATSSRSLFTRTSKRSIFAARAFALGLRFRLVGFVVAEVWPFRSARVRRWATENWQATSRPISLSIMDTIARHPLTSLGVVACFVALSLWLSFQPQAPGGGTPPVVAAAVGEQAEVTGRVTTISDSTGPKREGATAPITNAFVILDLGRGEAVCSFPLAPLGTESPAVGVQVGDSITLAGRVADLVPGRVYLSDCKLVHAEMP